MILGELVVVEIPARRIVLTADIDHRHGRIVQIRLRGFAPENRRFMDGDQ
jgi:hypothetical protein